MRQSQQQARAVLSVVVIVAVIGLAVLGWFVVSSARDQATEQVAAPTPVSVNEPVEQDSFSQLEDGLAQIPLAEPFVAVDGISFESPDEFFWYPISQEFGPAVFTGTNSSGFSRDTNGAALAAIHHFYRTSRVSDDQLEEASEFLVGPGVDARVSAANIVAKIGRLDAAAQKEFPAGWDVLSVSDAEDDIEILVYYADLFDETYFAIKLRVVWQDEAWHLFVPTNNDLPLQRTGGRPQDVDLSGAFR